MLCVVICGCDLWWLSTAVICCFHVLICFFCCDLWLRSMAVIYYCNLLLLFAAAICSWGLLL